MLVIILNTLYVCFFQLLRCKLKQPRSLIYIFTPKDYEDWFSRLIFFSFYRILQSSYCYVLRNRP